MPAVIFIAGPNGAGKSTAGPRLLRDEFGVLDFVNADVIAAGLSSFNPEGVAFQAGRILLERVRELAHGRKDFAVETTLAGRSYAAWIAGLKAEGYGFHLLFLSLPSADLAVERVANRVRMGGHNIPEDTIRRRYRAGLRNFFQLYRPLADRWRLYDSSGAAPRRLTTSETKELEARWT